MKGMSSRRVKGCKRVPSGTKTKRVEIILPRVIAETFGLVKK